MAEIPQFQRSSVNILGGTPRTTTDYTGLLAGASQAANAIGRYVERQRAADEAILKVSVDSAFREKRAAYSTLKGGQARGVSTDYIASEEALTVDQISDIKDPVTKSNMELYTAQKYEQNKEWVTKYQMQQDGVYRAQADEAYRRNIDTNLNEATTENLIKELDAAIKDATENFIKMEDPDEGAVFNYHKAVSDEFYMKHMLQRFKEDPMGMVKYWNENKDAISMKVSSGVLNALTDAFERNEGPAEVMRIYGAVRVRHGNDFLAGAAEIADPKNFKKYGIEENDYARANAVATMLRTQHAMNVALNKKQKEDRAEQKSLEYNQRTAAIAAMTDLDDRNLAYRNLINDIRLDGDMDQPDREKRIANLEKANYNLNPHKIASIKAQIDNGTITRNSQIHANLGDGIGEDTRELEAYLKSKQTFDKAGNGEDYVDRVRKLYMTRAVEQDTAKHRRVGRTRKGPVLQKGDIEDFMLRLEAKRRFENVTRNNPRILEFADELMSKGKQWYITDDGEEKAISEKEADKWNTFGEYLKFKFQEDPGMDVATEIAIMRGDSKTDEAAAYEKKDTIGKQIDKMVNEEKKFEALLATPIAIPGNTIADKADHMQGLWEAMSFKAMNDEQRIGLENTIRRGQ